MLVVCPHCGPRDAGDFHYLGATSPRPDPATVTEQAWRTYLHLRANVGGWQHETWYCRACRQHVVLERNTLTNEFRDPPVDPLGGVR
ncbi:MAG: sarcosine oxidase subunit delta [Nocardioidaceae bacterium]|nr:sarcosine oxidase subunit delta [Nocardioidaceae bacterium]